MNTKRRPDFRKVRDTKTYTIAELAIVTNRTDATVHDWLKDGLPTIDDRKPTLIYGWQFREWMGRWWGARRRPTPFGQISCFGCQEARQPKLGEVVFEQLPAGAIRAKAVCSVCGSAMFRTISPSDLVAFQDALHPQMSEISGFGESSSLTSSPTKPADFEVPTVHENIGTPNLGGARTLALPRNPFNERLKRQHFERLHEMEGYSTKSIRKYEIAVLRMEAFFAFRDFDEFTEDDAKALKDHIRACGLNLRSVVATLSACRTFLKFLAGRPEFEGKIPIDALQYLNLTKNEYRAAVPVEKIIVPPTLEEVDHVIRSMAFDTLIEKRNRAIFVLLAMTGIRASAVVSLRIKHIDFELGGVLQPGEEVDTKFGKSQVALFVPFDATWIDILKAYVDDLKALGFLPEDPLFPKSAFTIDQAVRFGERTIVKEFMGSTQLISNIVPRAFERAGLPRHTSHSFRHLMNKVAYEGGSTLRFAKAMSSNLGHSSIKVTNASYGKQTLAERREAIADYIARKDKVGDDDEQLDALLRELGKKRGLF